MRPPARLGGVRSQGEGKRADGGRGPLPVRRRWRRSQADQCPVNAGGALLAGRPDALLEVRGRQRHRLGERLPLQRGLEVRVAAVAQRDLGSRLAIGAVAGDAGGGLEHLVEERRRASMHPRDQAEPQRLVGVDDPAGEQQVAGVRPRRPRRAAGRSPAMPGVHARASRTARRAARPAAAYRRSQASARHSPAPIAGPLTAAMVGHLEPADRQPGPVERDHPGAQVVDRGVRLAGDPATVLPPEQNALPSPVTTTARTSRSRGQRVDRRAPRTRSSRPTSRCAGRGCRGSARRRPSEAALEAEVGAGRRSGAMPAPGTRRGPAPAVTTTPEREAVRLATACDAQACRRVEPAEWLRRHRGPGGLPRDPRRDDRDI